MATEAKANFTDNLKPRNLIDTPTTPYELLMRLNSDWVAKQRSKNRKKSVNNKL